MKLPGKAFSYNDSILAKFPRVLNEIIERPQTAYKLYEQLMGDFSSISEFVECLDCLYALGKVSINDDSEVISYVD